MLLRCTLGPFPADHGPCRLDAEDQVSQELCTHNRIAHSLITQILRKQAQAQGCQSLCHVRMVSLAASELRRRAESRSSSVSLALLSRAVLPPASGPACGRRSEGAWSQPVQPP